MHTEREQRKYSELSERYQDQRKYVVGDMTGRRGHNRDYCEVQLDDGSYVFGHPAGRMRKEARLLQ